MAYCNIHGTSFAHNNCKLASNPNSSVMIAHATRSSPNIFRRQRAAITSNMIYHSSRKEHSSPNIRSGVNDSHSSFSSVAMEKVHIPWKPYNLPRASLPSLHGSSVDSSIVPEMQEDMADIRSDHDTEKSDERIQNIQDFVDRIPEAVRLRKIENIEPGAFNDPVARLFRQTDLPPNTWQKYALFDNNKPYTRNLISTDNETYTLLLLCWNPEKESPIHDHPCDGCWLQVLAGGIREVRYDKQLNRVSQIDCHEGELSYITDNVGYHKVGNQTQKPAVTLHLYAPPFERCQCWHSDDANPSDPSEGKNVNHSEYGILKVE